MMDNDNKNGTGKSELIQLVSFKLGAEEFGVNILKVQEINRLMEITQMPGSPDFVEGIINLRDKVIPVINLRKRLHMDSSQKDKNTRIIVVEIEGRILGFIVDSVSKVLRISSDIIEPAPDISVGIKADYISGVAKLESSLLIFLDLNRVLSHEEVSQLNKAA